MTKKRSSISSYNADETETGSNSSPSIAGNRHNNNHQPRIEKQGWLQKWTNYVRGYRQRWFAIDSDGNLSYFRNPSEMNRACRGIINLTEANIHSSKSDGSNNLIITAPSSQTFHLKAANEVDRSQWLKALEYAKHRAIKHASTLEDDEDENMQFLIKTKGLKKLPIVDMDRMSDSVSTLCTKFRNELEGFSHYATGHLGAEEAKKCAEKARQLKSLADELIKSTEGVLCKYKREYESLMRLANSQNEKYAELQKQYKILARQHSQLERDAYHTINFSNVPHSESNDQLNANPEEPPPYTADRSDEDEGDEETFHDATDNLEEQTDKFEEPREEEHLKILAAEMGKLADTSPTSKFDLSKCAIQFSVEEAEYTENTKPIVQTNQPPRSRRQSVPSKPDSHGLHLWSFMRNCIGKELTRIPIPVNFNEPLSMLQRITEDLEYSYLIDRAAEKTDMCERLAYLAAFAVSCYSATAKRTTKPFNPLLCETFEFDRREDLGWRSLVEQVSHHPPAAAHYVEGSNWVLHQEFMVSSRFRGKYLSVIPTGHTHVEFRDGKANCTFQKVTTTVHNIIVGRLWIDNHGEMTIINHVSGERAIIKFHAYSYFSTNRPRKVEGIMFNVRGEPRFCIEGYWDSYINLAPVVEQKLDEKGRHEIQTGVKRRIWTVNPPHGANASQYFFTRLAIEMNEPDDSVAPTDSRRRPDQRLMEGGQWDEANKKKNQLEEKQRKVRRQAEAEAERAMNNNQQPDEYKARWFQKVQDANTGSVIHLIRDEEYWRCKASKDWSRCPNIF